MELAKFELIDGSRKDRREVEDLRCKVARDSEEIMATFAQLVLAVYRLLRSLEVELEEVRMVLLFMGCYKMGSPQQQVGMFSGTSDIETAPTLTSLIQALHNYSSWFNYRLIKFVAEKFGGEEGKKLIEGYEAKLKQYFLMTIAYQCPEFSLTDGLPEGYEQLEVKVAWDFRTSRLQDVTLFQAKLSELLGLEPHIFQLKSLEEGCVLITWAVPAVVAPHIVTEVHSCRSELTEVIEVRILGKCIEMSPSSCKHSVRGMSQGDCSSCLFVHEILGCVYMQ